MTTPCQHGLAGFLLGAAKADTATPQRAVRADTAAATHGRDTTESGFPELLRQQRLFYPFSPAASPPEPREPFQPRTPTGSNSFSRRASRAERVTPRDSAR